MLDTSDVSYDGVEQFDTVYRIENYAREDDEGLRTCLSNGVYSPWGAFELGVRAAVSYYRDLKNVEIKEDDYGPRKCGLTGSE